jgi:hypothetical protein
MVQAKRETAVTRLIPSTLSKSALLDGLGQRLHRGLGLPRGPQQAHDEWDEADQFVPKTRLRLAMLADPPLAAIIAESDCLFAPGDFADAPFRLAPRNVVGHSPTQSQEAVLVSEIEDAKRAISKLELLAENWPELKDIGP